MEELQTSLENARYESAIHETPRSVSSWIWPSKAEVERYISEHGATNSSPWDDMGKLCENPLGFHLFLEYVDKRGLRVLTDFIRACATYRNLVPGMRLQCATDISMTYLLCKYPVHCNNKWPSTLTRKLSDDISVDGTSYFDTVESTNCICVKGAPYEQVLYSIERAMSRIESEGLLSSQNSEERSTRNSVISQTSEEVGVSIGRTNRVTDIRHVISQSTRNALRRNSRESNVSEGATMGGRLSSVHSCSVDLEEKEPVHRMADETNEENHGYELLPAELFDVLDHIVFSQIEALCADGFKNSQYWNDFMSFLVISERSVTVDEFSYLRPVGRGGFGYVHACSRKTTGKVLAIKEMNIERIYMRKASSLVKNEKTILANINSPFILKLRYSFHDFENLYIVTDLMTGGDLAFQLKKRTRFSVQMAKYYAARTLLGVQALHSAGIIYRDLKPDNILLNAKGETKLVDMGLATKIDPGGLAQICGTRGYWAPDIIRRSVGDRNLRYTESADWFSLGCCLYEFLAGISPFTTPEALKWHSTGAMCSSLPPVDQAILEMTPTFDSRYFEPVVIDLLEKLLCKDGNVRLGANGAEEIKVHPWFRDINWHHMEAGLINPPFDPGSDFNILAQSDIGVFEENCGQSVRLQGNEDEFENWDYTSKTEFFSEVVDWYSQRKETMGTRAPVSTGGNAQCCCTS